MSLGVTYLAMAWTSPPSNPPSGNVDSPLNASITAQSKEGALVVGANSAVTTGLIVQYGNVGIGTTNPGAKLEVAGTGKITGTLDMSSQRIMSVAAPTASTDAATKAYVDASSGGGDTLTTWGYYTGSSPSAGLNAPSCPSGYTQLYAGYGPFSQYSAGTYAIAMDTAIFCSGSTTMFAGTVSTSAAVAYACPLVGSNPPYSYGTYYCNTCRVCVKN